MKRPSIRSKLTYTLVRDLHIHIDHLESQLKDRELRLKLYEDIFEGIYATAFQEHIQGTVRLNEVKKAVNYAYKRLKDGQ